MHRLQVADQRLGPLACALAQPLRWLRRPARPAPERLLLVKFWGLGSLQLLTPAVADLRARHPRASLELLTLADNAAFARGLGLYDEVLTLDVRAGAWSVLAGRILRLLARLERRGYDRVYDLEFFTRFSALVALATRAPEVHGFASTRVWRGGAHTRRVCFNRYRHVAVNFRALVGAGERDEVRPGELLAWPVAAAERRAVEELLRREGLEPERPLAVLNPNAGSLSLERRWPAERFASLASRLVLEDDFVVALVGSREERERAQAVARRAGPLPAGRLIDLSGQLAIGELCALLARAALVVSNDSGPMHLAAAAGVPTVGLFGPETPVMYAPLGTRTRALYDPPACSPCINVHDNKRSTCVHGRPECLMNLGVERVLRAARELRAATRAAPAAAPTGTSG
jgi:lipopolysaccharide heptosyltransferase II